MLAPFPCGTSPCIDPIFGPTQASNYLSSTTIANIPSFAWSVSFFNGNGSVDDKDSNSFARAVRAAPEFVFDYLNL